MRLITFLVFFWANSVTAQQSEWQPVIDDIIATERAGTIVVGFYEKGDTSMLVAGGPADGSSILEIGSVSKVFTSLLAQVLVDADELDWDQSLADSLPDVEFASDDIAKITLRELSTHTSGLPRLPTNMEITDPNDPYAGYDRKLLLDFLASFNPDSLDKSYEYSNYGAGLLGEIAAIAAHADYPKAMRDLVLDPLAMNSSTVGLRDEFADRLIRGYSDGRIVANWSAFDAMAGAGAITSSVEDMLTFINANFEKNEFSSALKAIRKKQGDGTTAYAWHLRGSGSDTVHWHNGGTGGYASFVGLNIKQRKGVVVLSASTDYNGITDLGFMMIDGSVPYLATDDLADFEGTYELSTGFYLTLFERDGRLHAQATGQGALPLTRTSETEFRFDSAGVVLTFRDDIEGQASQVHFSQGGGKTTAKRVDDEFGTTPLKEIEIDTAILEDFVGDYQLAPGAVITVENRDGQLYVMLTGQPFYPVYPFETDKFFYTIVDAKLIFGRDNAGKVTEVALDQGGLQTAPRIKD